MHHIAQSSQYFIHNLNQIIPSNIFASVSQGEMMMSHNVNKRLIVCCFPFLVVILLAHWLSIISASPSDICNVPGIFSTIQQAVTESTCEIIIIDNGTLHENVNISRTVTISGQGILSTTVDGNATDPVFTIQPNAVVTLTGMTITNGLALRGGGIHVLTSTLVLSALKIANNAASGSWPDGRGGGIHNSGTVRLTNCILISNSAETRW